jgi:glutaredoxin 2
MKPGSSARQIWAAIDNLFRGNKKSRAIALEAEFRNTPQGDMTVHDYCVKLKSLADALADVDQAVSDETLVLTVLRGLNEQFSHFRSFIPF